MLSELASLLTEKYRRFKQFIQDFFVATIYCRLIAVSKTPLLCQTVYSPTQEAEWQFSRLFDVFMF